MHIRLIVLISVFSYSFQNLFCANYSVTPSLPTITQQTHQHIVFNNFPVLPEQLIVLKNNIVKSVDGSFSFFSKNKVVCSLGLCVTLLYWLRQHIKEIESVFLSEKSWSNWHLEKSFQNCTDDQLSNISDLLVKDVFKRYSKALFTVDTYSISGQFLKDLQVEIDALNQYRFWVNYLSFFDRCNFFNLRDQRFIDEKLERLFFLLDLFLAQAEPKTALF